MKQSKRQRTKSKRVKRGRKLPAMEAKVNRKRMSVSSLTAADDDVAYWRSRTPAERLRHMELLRLINYGQAAVSGRLKRVFEVAQLQTR